MVLVGDDLIAGAAVWIMGSVVLAQSGSWLPCPRCQTAAQREAAGGEIFVVESIGFDERSGLDTQGHQREVV